MPKHKMIGGGSREVAGITGRYLLAQMGPTPHTSPHWTQKERDALVAGGRWPEQPSLFDACEPTAPAYIPKNPSEV